MKHLPISLSLVLALAAPAAFAQSFVCPDKNLNYWQAFPPGGESDISARHQQVVLKKKCPAIDTIVQYKAGGGGAILWSSANTLPADGLNVYGINLPHVVLQPLEGQVQYKTEDLVPVFWYHFTPDALVVPESSPFKTFADFLKAAKAEPGKYNLGGSALNSANHVAHERMNGGFGIKTTYVPYKGTAPLTQDLLGGQVPMSVESSLTSAGPNVKEGKLKAIAIISGTRSPLLPDVPTVAEQGYPGFDVPIWFGLVGPAGLPKDITAKLNQAVIEGLKAPEVVERFAQIGAEPAPTTPEGFAEYIRSENLRWGKVIRDAKITLE